jgi:hypothetical protein
VFTNERTTNNDQQSTNNDQPPTNNDQPSTTNQQHSTMLTTEGNIKESKRAGDQEQKDNHPFVYG